MTQFSLLSASFLILAWAAIVALNAFAGPARNLVFLSVNLLFLYSLLLGPAGTASTLVFCLIGFGLTRLIAVRPRWGLAAVLVVFVSLFVYMRRYAFLDWVLPESWMAQALSTIGLSFMFFKIVHVMVDVASGTLGTMTLTSYLNYCLNFTTFVMGPIQRYQDFSEQWIERRGALEARIGPHMDALLRILFGLTKAYVLAEWFQQRALQPDTDLLELSLAGLFVKVYAFYFFLYLNFSGYCDVAIGVGSLIGVKPPENFNLPFLSRNVSEFWQRQHRSLTLWLTDYVFSPFYKWSLGFSWFRGHSLVAVGTALMVTMLVSGLWHGTTLGFLLFGLTHGAFLVIYRVWDALLQKSWGTAGVRAFRSRWPVRFAGTALTFNATAFAFVFFQLDATRLERLLGRILWS